MHPITQIKSKPSRALKIKTNTSTLHRLKINTQKSQHPKTKRKKSQNDLLIYGVAQEPHGARAHSLAYETTRSLCASASPICIKYEL